MSRLSSDDFATTTEHDMKLASTTSWLAISRPCGWRKHWQVMMMEGFVRYVEASSIRNNQLLE